MLTLWGWIPMLLQGRIMNTIRQLALTFGILIVAGCSMVDPNGTLDGSVFIVTKAHESVKLGLVRVAIIAEQNLTAFLETTKPEIDSMRSEAETRYQAFFKDKVAGDKANGKAKAEYENAKAEYDKASARAEKAKAEAEYHGTEYYRAELDNTKATKAKAVYAKAYSEYTKARAEAADAKVVYDNAKAEADKQDQVLSKVLVDYATDISQNWERTVTAVYLRKLQSYTATTITDADGKFSVKLPRTGRFAVFATTERIVGESTEHYRWLVWASLDGQKSKTIFLSNQNQMGASDPDCIALLPPPTFTAPPM